MKKLIFSFLLLPLAGMAQYANYGLVMKYTGQASNSSNTTYGKVWKYTEPAADPDNTSYGNTIQYNPPTADEGIHFVHGLSWKEVQGKAQAEHKYIIIDCFTTWCGPCKLMSANVFPQKKVGDFFNEHYLAIKVQFDTTKEDNEEVKSWYADMQAIDAQYKVRAYPTYLIFDPNGTIVHRAIGYSPDADQFIQKGKDGMLPEKQYYTQLKRYEEGERSTGFLRNMALIAQGAYDPANAKRISNEYLATQTDLLTKENLEFLDRFTTSSQDRGFAVYINNREKVNAVLGEGKAEQRILNIVMQEQINPVIRKKTPKGAPDPDFALLKDRVAANFPEFADEAVAKGKVVYYQIRNRWNEFQTAVVEYMNRYGSKATDNELNEYAWTVFSNCKDMTCVADALEWSKRSFSIKENPMFMDTYANILHKLGKTSEAIAWEEKAMALAAEADKPNFQQTIDKMKKGERTWKETADN